VKATPDVRVPFVNPDTCEFVASIIAGPPRNAVGGACTEVCNPAQDDPPNRRSLLMLWKERVMATSTERRVSGVSERRHYHRGGRRREDRPDEAAPPARVHDVAAALATGSGAETQSSPAWTDSLTRDIDAVLSALQRLRP
jgi:hypothetical protein